MVIGLSGGIDSALVAAIAVDALGPENVTGVAMPGPYSSEGSLRDARALAENLGIDLLTLPINDEFRELPQDARRGIRRAGRRCDRGKYAGAHPRQSPDGAIE